MSKYDHCLLRGILDGGAGRGRLIHGLNAAADVSRLATGTNLARRREALRGRNVLLATRDQLAALLAMVALDGVARRIVLCTPGLSDEHVRHVARVGQVDALVFDAAEPWHDDLAVSLRVEATSTVRDDGAGPQETTQTEWVLLTSGTSGAPKLVVHTLASLAGAIMPAPGGSVVWSTFYDVRRFGGLQIALRALLGGAPLVLSDAEEPVGDFLLRAAAYGVTHMSGTPSHWRKALMSPQARALAPRYVRLSGEIADQAILDQLRATYPAARIAHAFASTEAGVAFEVGDGRAGFPSDFLEVSSTGVAMRVDGGTLRIRSSRTARSYLDPADGPLVGADGFVDTGDAVVLRDGRCYFAGRRGGVINVGGAKVHPEEVEAVINRHPGVRMSLVSARRSPITGAVVAADIVAADGAAAEGLRSELLKTCRDALDLHKVPAVIRFVPSLRVSASGKLVRPVA